MHGIHADVKLIGEWMNFLQAMRPMTKSNASKIEEEVKNSLLAGQGPNVLAKL